MSNKPKHFEVMFAFDKVEEANSFFDSVTQKDETTKIVIGNHEFQFPHLGFINVTQRRNQPVVIMRLSDPQYAKEQAAKLTFDHKI